MCKSIELMEKSGSFSESQMKERRKERKYRMRTCAGRPHRAVETPHHLIAFTLVHCLFVSLSPFALKSQPSPSQSSSSQSSIALDLTSLSYKFIRTEFEF